MIPTENNDLYYKLLDRGQGIVCCFVLASCLLDLVIQQQK